MKQSLIILTLCLAINSMMGARLGSGLIIANCPAVEVNQNGGVACIYIVDGYVQIELRINDEYLANILPNPNPYPSIITTTNGRKVDFSSIDGFTDHGIPLSEIYNGGYMINVPASDWNYSTFFFYVWLKDEDGRIVKHESFKFKDINICTGTFSPRLAQGNKYITKPALSEIGLIDESDSNFKIFPNPVNNDFNIEIPIIQTGKIDVELFNDKGQLIYANSEQVFEQTAIYRRKINNLHIPKGVYLCQITTDYGKKYTSKMVKL